jgi:hypothetical protein
MNVFKKYVDYLKDNPEGYWFKRRFFGFGWVPATREGWLVTLVFLAFLIWSGNDIASVSEPTDEMVYWFLVRIFIAVIVMITICYKTGEKPKWQWGVPDKDKED